MIMSVSSYIFVNVKYLWVIKLTTIKLKKTDIKYYVSMYILVYLQREGETEHSFIYWFTPQITATGAAKLI